MVKIVERYIYIYIHIHFFFREKALGTRTTTYPTKLVRLSVARGSGSLVHIVATTCIVLVRNSHKYSTV